MTVAHDPPRAQARAQPAADRTLRPPAAVVALGAVAASFFAVPLVGLVWRTPWSGIVDLLRTTEIQQAIWLSLVSSIAATVASMLFGVPLAWVLARVHFPGRALLRALVSLPMVLPPVVGGVALLLAFGRNGIAGGLLDRWFGVTLPFTTPAVVLAETFVAMPFLVITTEAAFRSVDHRLEEAARTLGAKPWTVFRRVTLPTVWPGIAAGAVLCWARAIGEFGATITFAGNFPGRTQTVPLKVYLLLERDPEAAIVLSLVLLVVSLAVLIGLRSRWMGPA